MGNRLEDYVEKNQQESSERATRASPRRAMPGGLSRYLDDGDDPDDLEYEP